MNLYSPGNTAAFDRAQAAYDSATPPEYPPVMCECGHEDSDHEPCPCSHGCDALPCSAPGCSCNDMNPIGGDRE